MRNPIALVDTHATWGGGQYQVLELLRGLERHGMPSLLVAHEDGPLAARAREAGLRVAGLPARLANRWWPGGGARLGRLFAREGVGLIHAHDSRALTLAQRAARVHRVPVVLSRRVASPLGRNPLSRLKYAPRRLAAIAATSGVVADMVRAAGYPASRTFVVESGTDVERLASKPPDDDLWRWADGRPLVGSVGKLVRKKNWELLVRAASALAGRGHDLRWVVAGDGAERSRLQALARSLGIADIVRFADDRRDPERVVKSLDVMFHPARREGGSAIIRVAMLSRVPLVVADAPAVVEAIGSHGLVVGADDVDGAARALERLLADEGERRRLVDGAELAARERFGIERMVRGTISVYDAVLGHRNA